MNQAVQPLGRMMLNNVRVAFAQGIFEAGTVNGEGKPRYSCSFLLDDKHPQYQQIIDKMKAVAKDKWKDKSDAFYKAAEKADKLALHDGDLKPQYDGYPGNWYLSAAAQEGNPPTVVNQDRTPFDAKKGNKKIYSGCFVNASIEFWAQDNAYGKRINCTLRGVQFFKDGDSFSAASAASSDEFAEVTDGNDAGDFA